MGDAFPLKDGRQTLVTEVPHAGSTDCFAPAAQSAFVFRESDHPTSVCEPHMAATQESRRRESHLAQGNDGLTVSPGSRYPEQVPICAQLAQGHDTNAHIEPD